jgi:MFS family permease
LTALSCHTAETGLLFKTIVVTALPTIVVKLGGGSLYSWVGTQVARYSVVTFVLDLFLQSILVRCSCNNADIWYTFGNYWPQANSVGFHSFVFGNYTFINLDQINLMFLILKTASALCGAAQSMIWLVLCRVVQGMGGGGILSLVFVISSLLK